MLGAAVGRPVSMDPRARVIAAIDAGLSRRAAAARYGVAPSTAIRWDKERRSTGSFAPRPHQKPRAATCGLAGSRRTPGCPRRARRNTGHHAGRALPAAVRAERLGLDLVAVAVLPAARDHKEKRPATPSNRIARRS
ncbi:MAG: hypothetical protein D6811_11490 [Alphaproteobacteria bacterium]|nr:MAG: hypothetical protein D6811_11490 [Alphaproteobacteria bacterium]